MFRRPVAVALALASTSLMLSVVACDPNDGKAQEEIFTEEDCLSTCEALLPLYSGTPGCVPTCGVDEADNYNGGLGIVTPIFGVALSGQANVGATCQLVLSGECSATCESAMTFCLSDAGYSQPAIEACLSAFDACSAAEQAETCSDALAACDASPEECQCLYDACLDGESGLDCRVCSQAYEDCEGAAEEAYDACFQAGGTTCFDEYAANVATCVCLFDACESGSDPQDCILPQGQPAMAPVQTGPGAFRLPGALVNLYLDNLATLDDMTGLLRTTNGLPKLAHLVDGHPLRSLGLRTGDVLVEANGISLKAAIKQPALLMPLFGADTDQVKLKIVRSGTARTLTYTVTP